jgi:hypothetical protein
MFDNDYRFGQRLGLSDGDVGAVSFPMSMKGISAMKRIAIATSVAALSLGLVGNGLAQRHDEKPHGMKVETPTAATAVTPGEGEQAIALKDGGTLILRKDGKMYHANAAGKRVLMKDGVVMESKEGERYMMKNDAVWKQITEKGTMHPNHP